ncbi:MAG TPA: signal peptidase I [Polyangiaceae bacterium]|nr:signal peptidase I [Polyangiaceae bacterium]
MSKFLRYLAWTLIILGGLVGILRLTVIRWWQVPVGDPYLEASLAPSLRGGDWLILWRGSAPIEGNLVLCPEPKAAGRYTIGRIVGESNDEIKLTSTGVLVNGRAFDTESGCDSFTVRDPGTGQETQQRCRREVVGSRTHLRGDPNATLPKPAEAEATVPNGHVYLISDNRQFPWDSREFGPVERSACAETVIFRVVSKEGFFDVPNRLMLIR